MEWNFFWNPIEFQLKLYWFITEIYMKIIKEFIRSFRSSIVYLWIRNPPAAVRHSAPAAYTRDSIPGRFVQFPHRSLPPRRQSMIPLGAFRTFHSVGFPDSVLHSSIGGCALEIKIGKDNGDAINFNCFLLMMVAYHWDKPWGDRNEHIK